MEVMKWRGFAPNNSFLNEEECKFFQKKRKTKAESSINQTGWVFFFFFFFW